MASTNKLIKVTLLIVLAIILLVGILLLALYLTGHLGKESFNGPNGTTTAASETTDVTSGFTGTTVASETTNATTGFIGTTVASETTHVTTTGFTATTSECRLSINNTDDYYNSSLNDPTDPYYRNRKAYYEIKISEDLQNSSLFNFTVTNVTVIGFIALSKKTVKMLDVIGLNVELVAEVSPLADLSLPGPDTIETVIEEILLLENPGWAVIVELLTDMCYWPSPYTLLKISPEVMVFARSKATQTFTISFTDQIQNMTDELKSAGYLRSRVVFIVHGFKNTINQPWLAQMAEALLVVEDDTVMVTGWGEGADLPIPLFVQAASNTRTVSQLIGNVAQSLIGPVSYFYCIGHSLGAHICGQAGKLFHFDRISGLDPAGPGFEHCPSSPGLNAQSAGCVDVLHTNGGWLGTMQQLGHVDFYFNCGKYQPDCNEWTACSHSLATDYFVDSIKAVTSQEYPAAQGPCNNEFFRTCQACTEDSCWAAQDSCQSTPVILQPFGFGSICYNTKKPLCYVYSDPGWSEYFGVWFVPVSSSTEPINYCLGLLCNSPPPSLFQSNLTNSLLRWCEL